MALGLIFIGSSSEEVFNELFSILMSRNDESKGKIFESPFFVLYVLGIGLLCLGKQKDNEFMLEILVSMESFSKDIDYDIDCIETDVWLTKDKVLVLVHGSGIWGRLKKFYNVSRSVTNPWKQISK